MSLTSFDIAMPGIGRMSTAWPHFRRFTADASSNITSPDISMLPSYVCVLSFHRFHTKDRYGQSTAPIVTYEELKSILLQPPGMLLLNTRFYPVKDLLLFAGLE